MSVTSDDRDARVHQLLERLVPLLEPPAGELPDAERVAALAEGRLPQREASELIEEIRKSPAARVELRALYPERYLMLLGDAPVASTGRVLAFPQAAVRRWVAVGVALAAAAALVFLVPSAPPSDAGAVLQPRSEAVRSRGSAEPGDRFHLLMHLGRPGLFDRLRGHEPWGALIQADESGVRLVCTSAEARCRTGADTMAWSFTAPIRRGVTAFVFVAAGQAPSRDEVSALVATAQKSLARPRDLASVVEKAAPGRWRVHPLEPVEVR